MLVVREPEQLRALGRRPAHADRHPAPRARALDRPSSREKLGLPKGTVGHHVKVLEKAGLVRVVRTRKVRALTEQLLRAHRAPLPLQEHRRRRRRGRPERRGGLPPDRCRGDAPSRTTTTGRPSPSCACASTDADARALRPPARQARATTSSPPTTRRASRTASRSRCSAERPMRRLRRPTGGALEQPGLPEALGRPVDQRVRLADLAARDPAGSRRSALHASPFEFSLLGVLGFLPFILFALPAGVWVDRLRRRRILIVGDAARAVLLASDPDRVGARTCCRSGSCSSSQFVDRHLHGLLRRRVPVVSPCSSSSASISIEGNSKLQLDRLGIAQVAGPSLAGGLIAAITAPYAIARRRGAASSSRRCSCCRMQQPRERRPSASRASRARRCGPRSRKASHWVVKHPCLRSIAACTGTSNFFGQRRLRDPDPLHGPRRSHLSSFEIGFVFAGCGVGSIAGALLDEPPAEGASASDRDRRAPIVFSLARPRSSRSRPRSFPLPVADARQRRLRLRRASRTTSRRSASARRSRPSGCRGG